MSVETLGLVVVPALALLLNYLMPSPKTVPRREQSRTSRLPGRRLERNRLEHRAQ
jgi:hypothetical protein